jgi:asparagine synthase (glutamine-hydrolysing)
MVANGPFVLIIQEKIQYGFVMCGISGIIDKNNKQISSADLEKMTDVIKHRGPDGFGYYYANSLGLGHRRLAILDLSESGKQPMTRSERWTMVYNGEVYNYLELREELVQHGFSFSSETDSEIILAAYAFWGEECVNKFNGMWAFAIYDHVEQTLFCSRDRFGIKPFYYTETESSFAFGSEIKQLLPFLKTRKVNKTVMINYLVLGLENYADETFFENVFELKPSHNLVYSLATHKKKIYRYYAISIDNRLETLSLDESVKHWSNEFKRSVTYRLRSDVEVGTCLSGGLDSSAVASIAAEITASNKGPQFSAFTAQSLDSSRDETEFARGVVAHCNLKWHTVKPKTDEFIAAIDQIIQLQEEPFGSPSIVMQYFVMQMVNKAGLKVLLDGQGGDETLLGYERYYPAYFLLQNPIKIPGSILSASRHSKLGLFKLVQYYTYFTSSKLRIKRQKKRWESIKKQYLQLVDESLVKQIADSYKDIKKLQITELSKTQLPHLLKYEDRNSMHFSIETRLPFLDFKLVEASLSIRNDYKIYKGWTKYILREAIKSKLPAEIVWRKNKVGFEAPVNQWLKNKAFFHAEIKNSVFLRNFMNLENLQSLDDNAIWKLFNVARWANLYNVAFD